MGLSKRQISWFFVPQAWRIAASDFVQDTDFLKCERENIHSCFDTVKCCLMPTPGEAIFNSELNSKPLKFRGKIITAIFWQQLTDLSRDFRDTFFEFSEALFTSGLLVAKRIASGTRCTYRHYVTVTFFQVLYFLICSIFMPSLIALFIFELRWTTPIAVAVSNPWPSYRHWTHSIRGTTRRRATSFSRSLSGFYSGLFQLLSTKNKTGNAC
jgi:hypothetical protein